MRVILAKGRPGKGQTNVDAWLGQHEARVTTKRQVIKNPINWAVSFHFTMEQQEALEFLSSRTVM